MNNNTVTFIKLKEVFQELWNKVKENFVTEVKYDSNDKKLKYTKNGQDIEITSVITKWGDLEHTTQSSLKNIFDKNTQIEYNKQFSFGTIYDNIDWNLIKIPCQAGDSFTIIKGTSNDSSQIGMYNDKGNLLKYESVGNTVVRGRAVYRFTIPNDLQDVAYFVNSARKDITDTDLVMVFRELINNNNDLPIDTYIPFADNASVLINSNEVALSFDISGTNLTSATIHSAIKELDKKIVSAGGGTVTSVNGELPQGGNVTIGINHINGLQNSLDSKVNLSEVGNGRNQIPRINGNGRLDESIMPDIAITEVRVIPRGSGIMNQTNIQTGDVIVVEDEGNKTYMCKNPQGANKNDRFVEINMGYPVVKEVNNQRPNQTGALDLNATHINATIENDTKTVERHLTDIGVELRRTSNLTNSYNQRLNKLETKGVTTRVGEIVTVLTTDSNDFGGEGCTFMYMGRDRLITARDYPQLTTALGLGGVTSFNLPKINDTTLRYDNNRTITQKHFMCVKKS